MHSCVIRHSLRSSDTEQFAKSLELSKSVVLKRRVARVRNNRMEFARKVQVVAWRNERLPRRKWARNGKMHKTKSSNGRDQRRLTPPRCGYPWRWVEESKKKGIILKAGRWAAVKEDHGEAMGNAMQPDGVSSLLLTRFAHCDVGTPGGREAQAKVSACWCQWGALVQVPPSKQQTPAFQKATTTSSSSINRATAQGRARYD